MTLFMKPEKLVDKYNRSLIANNSPVVTRIPGTLKTVEELEQEALLPHLPPSARSSGFCSRGTEYVSTMGTQRDLPDPHDLHDYLEVDVVSRLRSLQNEIDLLKNSVQTSDASSKSKDSCIYEKIEHKQPQTQRTSPKTSRLTQEVRSRGLFKVAKVCDHNTSVGCRVLWSVLMLACLGIAAFHVTDRAMLFYSSPFHFFIQNSPVQSLSFPDITICNLNQFRLTEVAKLGLYDIVYASQHDRASVTSSLAKYTQRPNLTYERFSRRTAHSKNDFIHRCQWRDSHCGQENFTEIFTAHGLCYKFSVHSSKRTVTKPGQSSGVFFAMNVEQYEYILGPMSAVGVSIAVHEPGEPPAKFVHIPVGKYTSLELSKSTELSSSTIPCKGGNLRQCEQSCRDLHIARRCRCTFPPFWMYKDTYRQCLFYDYIACVQLYRDKPYDCQCDRTHCESSEYKISSSYATIPKYGAESEVRTLRDGNRIQKKFRTALDTYHRVDKVIAEYDKTTLQTLSAGFAECASISDAFVTYIKGYVKEFKNIIEKLRDAFTMYNRTIFVHYQSIKQGQHIYFARFIGSSRDLLMDIQNKESELSKGWDEQKAVDTANDVLWNIKQLAGSPGGNNFSSSPFLEQIQEGLVVFRTKVANSFNGAYGEFKKSSQHYNDVTGLMLQITKSMEKKLVEDYNILNDAVESTSNRLSRTTQALRRVFNNVGLMRANDMRRLLEQETVLRTSFHRDQRTILQDMEKVDGMSYEFDKQFDLFNKNISRFVEAVNVTKGMLDVLGDRLANIANDYTEEKFGKIELSHEIAKAGIMELVLKLQKNIHQPNEIMESMPREGRKLSDTIGTVTKHLQGFNLARGTTFAKSKKWFEFEELNSRSSKMLTKIVHVIQAMTSYQGEIHTYTSGRKIDEVFYRNNFLYVDIYFKDMTETVSRREKTYGLLDLSCDIGGVLALFLGISLLSIFDILDLIATLACRSSPSAASNSNR